MSFYCFRYDFSVALFSALALSRYANLRLTVEVQKQIVNLRTGCSYLRNAYYVITFCYCTHVLVDCAYNQLTMASSQDTDIISQCPSFRHVICSDLIICRVT